MSTLTGEPAQPHTMAETLPTLQECSLFSDAIKTAGLDPVLGYSGMHTLFAPANSALGDHPPTDLFDFVNEHLVEGAMHRDDLSTLTEVTTSSGRSVAITRDGQTIRIGGETLQRTDVQCTNGVIHVVA